MTTEDVRSKVEDSIERLIESDAALLNFDVNERSISHRIALYLEDAFPEWDVDCEYNRIEGDPKRLGEIEKYFDEEASSVRDTEARTVYPDVIVHERTQKNNLLAIEVKKSNSSAPERADLEKLRGYLEDPSLEYDYGCFVQIGVGENAGECEIRFVDDR